MTLNQKKIMDYFKDKVFIVTGASSGLGLEISKQLVEKGCRVVLFARNIQALNQASDILSHPVAPPPLTISGDVTREEDVKGCIEKIISAYGRVDGMVLNAGKSMWKKFLHLDSPQEMRDIMEVNFWGVVNFCYYGIPHIKNSNGRIVIISSLQSLIGVPYHTGYAASKHALNGFVESLRLEEKISVLNVIVSWIRGTSLRKNSLSYEEKKQDHSDNNGSFSVMVDECARKIIAAIPHSRKVIYLPGFTALFPLVKSIFPDWLARKIKKTVDKEFVKTD